MAKAEYDKTPLEVEKVATERLKDLWAYAVAKQVVDSANLSELNLKFNKKLGRDETFEDKYPLLFESLHNRVALHLIAASEKNCSPFHNPATGRDYGELSG